MSVVKGSRTRWRGLFGFCLFTFGKGGQAFVTYVEEQKRCARGAPNLAMKFHDLVLGKNVAFRDVTPFFQHLVSNHGGKDVLIRPRRWGKSVLGTAWVEFLRGRSDLFVGTWAETRMRKDKLIGVHLDMSLGGFSVGQCTQTIMHAINEGLELAEKVDGYGEDAKGRRLSISAAYLQQNPDPYVWALGSCTALVNGFLNDLEAIAEAAGRQVAIFVDEYDRPLHQCTDEAKCGGFQQVLSRLLR